MGKMKLGYIRRHNLELNPQLTERFTFKECTFTRRISSRGDKVYCKLLYPFEYEELIDNAEMMKKHPGIILVNEPFLLDDELREKAIKWVEWANHADPSDYDPFAPFAEILNPTDEERSAAEWETSRQE